MNGNEKSDRCGTTFCMRCITMLTFENGLENPVMLNNYFIELKNRTTIGARKIVMYQLLCYSHFALPACFAVR